MHSGVISHYRIIRKLGQGGMGEVYLADDSVLGRKVAIKVLPEDSVSDDQARRRLLREARAAATLDHPNICSIHEVGDEDGSAFIVMQYVEGQTLSERLREKPMSLKESLDIASQIASALEEAHSRGVVHRDIKPQNIIMTPRGLVKVLDFGLAKILPVETDASAEQTQSLLTDAGMVIGTAPYMSPEQAKCGPVDARSDLFSLGAVLYECVTGTPAFSGSTPMEICARVIH
ncbi:MAG TPA: serine/threonine-protein kinase, partial [Blastocatellia bacterium]|nr:serine/threonine-protein kinase [Blastocatellia bacterium]